MKLHDGGLPDLPSVDALIPDIAASDAPPPNADAPMSSDVLADSCVKQCGQRVCGPDPVCALLCGSCQTGSTCNVQGQCEVATQPEWTIVPPPSISFSGTYPNLNAIWADSSTNVWFGGDEELILRYDGVGVSVEHGPNTDPCNTPYERFWTCPQDIKTMWGLSPGDVWAGAYWENYRRIQGSWTAIMRGSTPYENEGLLSVFALSTTDAWGLHHDSLGWEIHRWDGASWTFKQIVDDICPDCSGGGGNITRVWASQTSAWFSVGSHSAQTDVYLIQWDGNAYAQVTLSVPSTFKDVQAIWGTAANSVWAAGDDGSIMHYDGFDWTWEAGPITAPVAAEGYYGISGTSASDVWMVGSNGRIAHFDGAAWTEIPSPTFTKLLAVAAVTPTDVWAAGEEGTLLRYH